MPPHFVLKRKRVRMASAIAITLIGISMALMRPPASADSGDNAEPSSSAVRKRGSATEEAPDKLVAFYFHGTVRCVTCLQIERLARETVFDSFMSELRAGKLEWRAVNYEAPGNQHYSSDFELPHPSLVFVHMRDGFKKKHRVLDEVWTYVEDPNQLRDYVLQAVGQDLAILQ